MFGSVVAIPPAGSTPASLLPRPRPVEAVTRAADASPSEPKPAEPKAADAMANLVKSTGPPAAPPSNMTRPPAVIPPSPHIDPTANPRAASPRRAAAHRAPGD